MNLHDVTKVAVLLHLRLLAQNVQADGGIQLFMRCGLLHSSLRQFYSMNIGPKRVAEQPHMQMQVLDGPQSQEQSDDRSPILTATPLLSTRSTSSTFMLARTAASRGV